MIIFQCPKCQARIKAADDNAGLRVKCPKCGSVVQIPDSAVDVLPADAESNLASGEKVFYNIGGVRVTNSRIIIPSLNGNTTLSTHLVSSVSVGLDPNWQRLAKQCIVGGAATILCGIGFFIIPIGICMMFLFPRYALLLTTSGSVEPMLATWSRQDLIELSGAIQEAINYQVSRR